MKLKLQSVLILGGAGFIGSHLAAEFLKRGAQVTIVDGLLPNTGGSVDNIRPIIEDVKFYNKKIEKLENLSDLVDASDIVVDSMGMTSHSYGMKNPLIDLRINLTSHIHVINALGNHAGKKVVYLGSRAQYGKAKDAVINEHSPQVPVDTQGTFKTAAENLYRIYGQVFGYQFTSFRITNSFGEKQKTEGSDIGLVGLFIRDILNGEPVDVYGDIRRKKNIIYVKDLAKLIALACEINTGKFEAFNVAGIELSLERLLNSIINIAGKGDFNVKAFPDNIKTIDVGEARFDGSKLTSLLGDFDYTPLDISVTNTLNYFEKSFSGSLKL